MANFGDLLGAFLNNNMTSSGNDRIGNALNNLQRQFGGGTGAGHAGAGGMLGSVLDIASNGLGGLLGGALKGATSGAQTGAGQGGLGAILQSVLRGGAGAAGGAGGGILAMLAGVAYNAMTKNMGQNYNAVSGSGMQFSGGTLPVGVKEPETAAERDLLDNKARLIIQGMINIAKADGELSSAEVQRISAAVDSDQPGADADAWLQDELARPLDLDAFVAEIPSHEVAAEVYAASLLAVEIDTQSERDYLEQFAIKTGLPQAVVAEIQQTLGVVPETP